ncbi:hypothetical protein A1O3_03179 [Capronia epimyces CBS 606.96]|uniref:Uncharacterized protein n=1 Tax=Capronia epimyces CBS 606.96 TaxID=1182542 RepID=W9YK98_9EURO|nr:uncharacterized protein A1O3_03179 [Capronia epimyces CBS 606.96]EXJ90110.1 hypothetical protein A1O3_03179 [Capronia epimyces CBS 606.96]
MAGEGRKRKKARFRSPIMELDYSITITPTQTSQLGVRDEGYLRAARVELRDKMDGIFRAGELRPSYLGALWASEQNMEPDGTLRSPRSNDPPPFPQDGAPDAEKPHWTAVNRPRAEVAPAWYQGELRKANAISIREKVSNREKAGSCPWTVKTQWRKAVNGRLLAKQTRRAFDNDGQRAEARRVRKALRKSARDGEGNRR